MGSKNLKAIAVRGSKRPEIYDPDGLRDFLAQLSKEIRENPSAKTYHDYGTHAATNLVQKLGVYPTKYWSRGTFDKYYEINSDALQSKIFVKNDACFNCPIACGRYVKLREGKYAGLEDVPDYEGYYSFGSLCEVGDINAVTVAHYLCDKYGMDVISAGNSIAFAMYLYEKGKLKSDKPIKFGDPETVLELLNDIAFRKGLGDPPVPLRNQKFPDIYQSFDRYMYVPFSYVPQVAFSFKSFWIFFDIFSSLLRDMKNLSILDFIPGAGISSPSEYLLLNSFIMSFKHTFKI